MTTGVERRAIRGETPEAPEPLAGSPYIPDLGDTSVEEMRALKSWHEDQADKHNMLEREHRRRAEHLTNAITDKTTEEGG